MKYKLSSFFLALIFLIGYGCQGQLTFATNTNAKKRNSISKTNKKQRKIHEKNYGDDDLTWFDLFTVPIALAYGYLIYSLFNPNPEDSPKYSFRPEFLENREYGIPNLGVSCYLNSAIQILYRSPAFKNAIYSNEKNITRKKTPWCWAVLNYFKILESGEKVKYDFLEECASLLGYEGRQCDSCEIFHDIIDNCSKEINSGKDIIDLNNYVKPQDVKSNGGIFQAIRLSMEPDADKIRKAENLDANSSLSDDIYKKYEGNVNFLKPLDVKTNGETEIFLPFKIAIPVTDDMKLLASEIPKSVNLQKDLGIENGGIYNLNRLIIYSGNGFFGHYYVLVSKSNVWYKISDDYVRKIGNDISEFLNSPNCYYLLVYRNINLN